MHNLAGVSAAQVAARVWCGTQPGTHEWPPHTGMRLVAAPPHGSHRQLGGGHGAHCCAYENGRTLYERGSCYAQHYDRDDDNDGDDYDDYDHGDVYDGGHHRCHAWHHGSDGGDCGEEHACDACDD